LFNKYQCAFNSLTESIDTQTATGRMFIKIIGIFAEFERENIIERVKIACERKVKEGYTLASHSISYGYDRKIGQKIQTINEKEAVIVRDIFKMFVDSHVSYYDIAQKLNDRNIPSKTNSVWYAKTIKNILTNCTYIGNVRYSTRDDKKYFESKGVHKPIVSEELYNEAQALIKKKFSKTHKKHPKEDNYFASALICGICNAQFNVHSAYTISSNGQQVPTSYRCSNRIKRKCNACQVQHHNMEKAFSEYIKKYENFDTLDEVQIEAKKEIKNLNLETLKDLKNQTDKLERKRKEIQNKYIEDSIDFESYTEIKNKIENDKKQIELTIKSIEEFVDEEITIKKENIIKNLKENWEYLNNAEKRQFIVNFIEHIEIVNEMENRTKGTIKILHVEFYKE
jgi:site-specific DNA recombinase